MNPNPITQTEIDNLPHPPQEWIDELNKLALINRNQNGDFGLLPREIWNNIYDIKNAMEKNDIKIAGDKKDKIILAERKNQLLHLKYIQSSPNIIDYNSLREIYNDGNRNVYTNRCQIKEFLENISVHWGNEYGGSEYMIKLIKQLRPRKNKVADFNRFLQERITFIIDQFDCYHLRQINNEFINPLVNIWNPTDGVIKNNFYDWVMCYDQGDYMDNLDVIEDNKDCEDIAVEFLKRSHNPIFDNVFRSGEF